MYKDEFIIALTGDHTTPNCVGDHSFEPVPFTVTTYSALANYHGLEKNSSRAELLSGFSDKVQAFNEVSACEGILGRFPASELMKILKNFRNKVEKTISS
jgi:Predicted phosphoglycerate mutase, AP superfamily